MSEEDATAVVTTMAQYKEFFVDVMMMEELHLQLPEKDHRMESFREGECLCLFDPVFICGGRNFFPGNEQHRWNVLFTVRIFRPSQDWSCSSRSLVLARCRCWATW